jgi:hypothetical protein
MPGRGAMLAVAPYLLNVVRNREADAERGA